MLPARPPCNPFLLFLCLLFIAVAVPSAGAADPPAKRTAEQEYQQAADQFHQLEQNPAAGRKREAWIKEAQKLEQIYRQYPQSRTASSCLHLTARIYWNMYQRFKRSADLDQAVALFGNVVSLFPKSSEAAEALFSIARIEQTNGNLRGAAKNYLKLVHDYPYSGRKRQAEEQLRQLTVIAESLTARKNGGKVSLRTAVPTPQKLAAVVKLQTEEKPSETLPPPAPVAVLAALPKSPSQPLAKVQEKAAASPKPVISAPLFKAETLSAQEKTQQKLILPLPAPAAKPVVPPKAAPAAEKEQDTSLLAKISFPDISLPFFNSDIENASQKKAAAPTKEKKKQTEPVKPAAVPVQEKKISSVPAIQAAAPSTPDNQAEQSRIVVSALKIASLEPEKPTPAVTIKPKPESASEPPKQTLPPIAATKPEPQPPKASAMERAAEEQKTPVPAAAKTASTIWLPEQAAKNVTEESEKEKPALVELLPIQHWSSDSYSRVALNASDPAVYHVEMPDKNNRRLRIEFKQSYVAPEQRIPIAVENGLIKKIRAEQADAETVQVFLELDKDAECKVFSLSDPFRVVVDVRSIKEEATASKESAAAGNAKKEEVNQEDKKKETAAEVKKESKIKPAADAQNLTLAQQLGLGIRRIMIDPGHGGKDSGATGFGLQEKRIALDVAKRVREILKKEGYEILLTRETDVFIPLEERTAIANTKKADLFLSIHVNAHPKAWVKGVETFYLNLAANPEAMRVAALENATSSRSMSEMQGILTDLMKNTKIDESSLLAEFIQTSMATGLRKYKSKSLGVKKAPFYVLIGAQMPAVLTEISFISNKYEAELLKDDQYLQRIAEQIAAGVISYIEQRRTAATAASTGLL